MIRCPNRNDPKWIRLVEELGEDRAYQAFFRHNEAEGIPEVHTARNLLRGALEVQAQSAGPGAAAAGEPGTYTPIQELSDRIQAKLPEDAPVREKFDAIEAAKSVAEDVKESATGALAKVVAAKDALFKSLTEVPKFSDTQRAVGEWTYANQKNDFFLREFAKSITEQVPSKLRREAITNYIQAEGNPDVLRLRANASKGKIKDGYEAALTLTSAEKRIANQIRDYYSQMLEDAQDNGLLTQGVENYVNQVWERENPVAQGLKNELANPRLKTDFRYAKKRLFDSYFEGEQAGFSPKDKDIGALVSSYDQAFARAISSRKFIQDLSKAKASDSRPVVVPSSGIPIITDEPVKPSILIKSDIKPENAGDYVPVDHPAMRGWRWIGKTPEGGNIMYQGELLVHPEEAAKLKNRLGTSAIRRNPVGRFVLEKGRELKSTLMSVSGFHQVQEALHSLGHRVNPANLEPLDVENPVTVGLMKHGLQLVDHAGQEAFSEGLSGSGLLAKVPGLGKLLTNYNDYLFQDFIPRLKVTMAKEALARNRERYRGELSDDQIQELTARQANVAFGELPYRYWGRNPTFQDALRVFLLAPDFLESRGRFVAQAAKPYGAEQLHALALLGITQYITARVLNQVLDDDPHFELKHAFDIVYKGHTYNLRTIPTDIAHLFTDPRSFVYHRISQFSKPVVEFLTGRDDRGVKRTAWQQVKDFAASSIPITLHKRDDQNLWESFLGAFGVNTRRYSADREVSELARDWKKANLKKQPEIVYDADADEYRPLRLAIEDRNSQKVRDAVSTLEKSNTEGVVNRRIERYFARPFTNSKANDAIWEATLTGPQKKMLEKAREERRQSLKFFESATESGK